MCVKQVCFMLKQVLWLSFYKVSCVNSTLPLLESSSSASCSLQALADHRTMLTALLPVQWCFSLYILCCYGFKHFSLSVEDKVSASENAVGILLSLHACLVNLYTVQILLNKNCVLFFFGCALFSVLFTFLLNP